MSAGESTWAVQTGGGQVRATSQQIARAVAHLGCSPLLPVNTVLQVSDPSQILSALDYCELAEAAAFTARKGLTKYVVAVTPSIAGGLSAAVTQTGTGTGTVVPALAPHKLITVLCVLGGVVGVATFRFSLDGGVTYGPLVTSAATIPVPGTYATLAFAAATYVATKTCTISTTGVVTNGSGWVGVVTISATSPMFAYEALITVVKGGALGTAIISVSLDNGNSLAIGSILTPSGGVIAIPNTGIYVTLSGTFITGDTYAFLAYPPSYSTTDITNAMNALKANPTVAASLIHLVGMPASAAAAFANASTLETALESAFSARSFDWCGISDCPSNKGGTRFTSAITGYKHQVGASWFWVDRYCDTDPRHDLAAYAAQGDATQGAFRAFLPAGASTIAGLGDIVLSGSNAIRDSADTDSVIAAARGVDLVRMAVCVGGRDEEINPGLDDSQINTFRTYNGPLAVYGTISAGIAGYKNLSSNTSWVDAGAVRGLNVLIATLRPLALAELGQKYDINLDGTIAPGAKKALDAKFDQEAKKALGMIPGGAFAQKQAALVTASVLPSSQLGASPKRLDISYQYQALGEATAVANNVAFAGTFSVSQ